MSQTIQLFRTR